MKAMCWIFGHRLSIHFPRGRTFIRSDGVECETKPTEAARLICKRGCPL